MTNKTNTVEEDLRIQVDIKEKLGQKNETNVSKILENAPAGLKLYSTVVGDVKLHMINIDDSRYPILLKISDGGICQYSSEGKYLVNYILSECTLFPSKENKSWDNWQSTLFKSGDIITNNDKPNLILLFSCRESNNFNFRGYDSNGKLHIHNFSDYHYATVKEIDKFKKALESNGFIWEKFIKEEKEKMCCEIKKEESNIEFTVNDFKPFDRVLVRCDDSDTWRFNFFSHYYVIYGGISYKYACVGGTSCYYQCIPYNDETKYLANTRNSYEGKYKTWKNKS